MAKRKTRKHPGVYILPKDDDARTWHRYRYIDPDTGRTVKRTFDRALRTRADREDYACKLSDRLARRRLELESGAPRATGTPFADGIQRYYSAHPKLRPSTLRAYRDATDKLVRFAKKHRIRTVDDLDRRKLMVFREQIVNEPKRYSAARGRRGAKRTNGDTRSAYTVNRELRAVGTCLRYLVDADLFARLSHDDVRRCCKLLKVATNRKKFLRPAQIKKLLTAALRHDAATFKATRAEHGGAAIKGGTPKYPPVSGFALYILLTGCRLGEALRLQWADVHLDDGEIHIGTESKTSKPRDIDITPSAALARLLAAQRLRTGRKGSVWGLTEGEAGAAMDRLRSDYAAPPSFTFQVCRVSCQSFLASAPSIYGAASIFLAARRGGHSVAVCEKHYAGAVKNISPEAKTLEAAMQIEREAKQVIASIAAPTRRGLVAV
jgi:integrase